MQWGSVSSVPCVYVSLHDLLTIDCLCIFFTNALMFALGLIAVMLIVFDVGVRVLFWDLIRNV